MRRLKSDLTDTNENNTIYKDASKFNIRSKPFVVSRQFNVNGRDIVKADQSVTPESVSLDNMPLLAHYSMEQEAVDNITTSNKTTIQNFESTKDIEEIQ